MWGPPGPPEGYSQQYGFLPHSQDLLQSTGQKLRSCFDKCSGTPWKLMGGELRRWGPRYSARPSTCLAVYWNKHVSREGNEHHAPEAQCLLKDSKSQLHQRFTEVLLIWQESHRVWLLIEEKLSHSCLAKQKAVSPALAPSSTFYINLNHTALVCLHFAFVFFSSY